MLYILLLGVLLERATASSFVQFTQVGNCGNSRACTCSNFYDDVIQRVVSYANSGYYYSSNSYRACPRGRYSVYTKSYCVTSCSQCPGGTYPANNSGNYVSSTAVRCVGCPSGKVCDGTNAPATCGNGTYKSGNTCASCPVGHYCLNGTKHACPAGQYQNKTHQSSCLTCASAGYGKYTSSSGRSSCSNCSGPNQHTDAHRTKCLECGAGFVANSSNTGCMSCPAGKYESSSGICSACGSGYWSAAGKTSCTRCPTSATHNSSHTSCVVNAGYYLTGSMNPTVQGDIKPCEPGYRCNDGARYACSDGYYQPSGTQSGCLGKCAAGSYTLRNGSPSTSAATECRVCPAGYACPGSGVRNACTGSHYQPFNNQTVCKTCPTGSYTPDSTSCTRCQAGYECPNGDARRSCTAPKYSTGGATACSTCGTGHYMTKSGSLGTSCHACPVGQYQDVASQTECKACPTGTEQPATGQPACVSCANGSYAPTTGHVHCQACSGKDQITDAGHTTCGTCPGGQVADGDHLGCETCGAGYAELSVGVCSPCHGERQWALGGGIACGTCPALTTPSADHGTCVPDAGAFVAPGGNSTVAAEVQPCPVGHKCAGANAQPVACVNGAYQPATGQDKCLTDCAATSYTRLGDGTPVLSAATHCAACERGYECPGAGVRRVCSGAKYSVASAAGCSTCATGSYTTQSAEAPEGNDVCTVCEAGHFCADGDVRQDCEGKLYSHAGAEACSECGVGHYVTKNGALSVECTACPADTFQPAQGQTSCPACPIGATSGTVIDTPAEGATTCTARSGYFVPTGGDPTVEVEACAPGYTCAGLWAQPVPCGLGWYQPQAAQTECLADCPVGNTLVDVDGAAATSAAVQCKKCPSGHACSSLTEEPGICHYGFFSPGGTTPMCTPCAMFFYADTLGQPYCEYCEQEYAIYRPLNTAQRCTYCPAKQYFNGMQCQACVFTKVEPYYCERRVDGNADVLYIRRPCGAGYVREDAFTCRKCNADETCAGGATSPKWEMEWKFDPSTKSGQILIASTVAGATVLLICLFAVAYYVHSHMSPRRRSKDARCLAELVHV